MSSGYFSGEASAKYALKLGAGASNRKAKGLSEATGVPKQATTRSDAPDTQEIIKAVQAEVFPYDRNWFRTGEGLQDSLGRLNHLWHELKQGIQASDGNVVRVREAAAMTATARWMFTSGLERKETRGMHRRDDFPRVDQGQQYRIISGGLDTTWAKPLIDPSFSSVKKEAVV